MFKLFKLLKKYLKPIILIILLIAVQAVATLQLPNITSKVISEGIKSPAYETTKSNGSGEKILSVINAQTIAAAVSQNPQSAATYGVKKYSRSSPSALVLDGNGFAQLANADNTPSSGKIEFERYQSGGYALDPDTGEKIVKYVRTSADSFIIADEQGNAIKEEGFETDGSSIIIAPYVTPVLIYSFDVEPAPLKLDNGNAVFAGFYMNGNKPLTVKFGAYEMHVMKFDRIGEGEARFGTPHINEEGYAVLKQVSYVPVILKFGLIMLGITLLITICAITANYFSSRVSMDFGRDLRGMIYKKVSGFSVFDAGKFGTASLITRSTNDVTQVQNLVNMLFRMVVMTPIMFVGGLIMALGKSAQMTVVLLVSIPLILLLIFFVGKAVMPIFKSMQQKIDNLTLVARENLTGVRVIRAFNREGTEDRRFDASNRGVTDIAIKANRIMSVLMPIVTLIMSLTALAVTTIAVLIAKNNIGGTTYAEFGNMMAVMQYIMQIMISILMVMMLFVIFPRASASATRINEVLETGEEITDPINPAQQDNGIRGNVKFQNVGFRFKGSEGNVLSDITFEAKAGETTAIIGSTGSGKSTLINLIPRLFDASTGEILVNGINVKDYKQKDLRAKIGFVPQKALLFSGSIAQNVAFGQDEIDREKVARALEISQSKEFVDALEKGMDSEVEQGGVNFSGGQKQRLSIARALYRESEIFIFDDSFSALDFKTDAALRSALKANLKNSALIIVAQRIGSVMNADNIIVLDDGRIVGMGRHKELMKDCPVYREIALSQLGGEELL